MRIPEAATVPLASLTAACGLFASNGLALNCPWMPTSQQIPLVIYAASSAVGYYAVQLALRASFHPLICIAGKAGEHVQKLLNHNRGDTVIDYRDGNDAYINVMKRSLEGRNLKHAFDVISEKDSHRNIAS